MFTNGGREMLMDVVPDIARKGRGAVSSRSGRFETEQRVTTDDGWGSAFDPDLPPLRTTLSVDTTRTILARNNSPDVPFDRSINPYRGCEHGCIYCFARPTHAFLGLSPGLDFETKLFFKPDGPELLERELRAKSYKPQVIAVGANTDPYQPVEREQLLTRRILQVLARFENPVAIITKSALIARDLDILGPMAAKNLVRVCVSVTTLDRDLARKMEPRASTPPKRIETIRALKQAGVPVTVLTAPMIPALNDHELEDILIQSAAAGADSAGYVLLRLPLEIKDLFEDWLRAHFPDRAERVLSLVRQCRDGALYQNQFGMRMKGTGPYAVALAKRFQLACKRLGLNQRRLDLDTSRFRPPPANGDQLALF